MADHSPRRPSSRAETRKAVVTGILIGVLVFAVGLTGVIAWQQFLTGPSADPGLDGPGIEATPRPSRPMPAVAPELERFYAQKLDWSECAGGECATMSVPLDYARPRGRTISIALLRVPARDSEHKLGDLVVNPGGPGGSGVDYAAAAGRAFRRAVLQRYDIVGFDPRGVGRSTALTCLDTAGMDAMVGADPDPDDAAERAELDRLIHGFGEACLRNSGALTRHISTEEAARDMDVLRGALGQSRLDYFGASYGTFLGATYADLFPDRVGRMVLDGAVDPSLSNLQMSLAQARGFEVALRAYVASCVEQGDCVLGDSVAEGTRRVRAFLDDVEQRPLDTGADRELTAGWAMIGIWMPLYAKAWWPELTGALEAAIEKGDGSRLLDLADLYASRGSETYTDNSLNVLYGVNCLDHDDYVPTSRVPSYFDRFDRVSPTFGRTFAFGLSTCSVWPVKSGKASTALHARGAPPILVLGTTRDPATPLAWAQGLARELDSGVLVTRDGDGHTAYNQGNRCVNDAVERYLLAGTVPADGTSC